MDLLALEGEPPPKAGQEMKFWPLGRSGEVGKVTPAAVEILHRVYLKDGQVGRVRTGHCIVSRSFRAPGLA